MKIVVTVTALIFACIALSACGNTFVGVGKDIMTIGEKMQKDISEDK